MPVRETKMSVLKSVSGAVSDHAAAAIAAGCTSINYRWDDCEKGASTFVQVADCTIEAVKADAGRASQPTLRMRSEQRAKQYIEKAEDLMEKVGTGRMPDQEARAELRHALDELMDSERDDRLNPIRQPPRMGVTCSPVGNTVSCTQN